MTYSLNEVELTAKKAARGAGYPWGMAEEAGKATRWLCQQGLDGCLVLAELLKQSDGADLADWSPKPNSSDWNIKAKPLCPIMTGAAISDHANGLRIQTIHVSNVLQPLLLLPFAAMAARQLDATITLTWSGCVAQTNGHGLHIHGDQMDGADFILIKIDGPVESLQTQTSRSSPDADAWAALGQFAHRTYAPATAESRAKGAGAGITDND